MPWKVARRMSEGRVDVGVAHAFRSLVDKDVRRFFQSPVDAAPGTVDAPRSPTV